jgi:phosphoribosylglycinamide formyltransferase 1
MRIVEGTVTNPAERTNDGPPAIAVLLSGSGRTLQNLLRSIQRGDLRARIVHVISSRHRVRGIEIARAAEIPLIVVARREYSSIDDFSDDVFTILGRIQPNLVVCAGFLSKIVVPDEWLGRIINIHPSLLPLFGGKGFYGDRVHRAVLDSGMRVSGCTVHFLDNEYDAGPIIAQRCVRVEHGDTVETLAARVFETECDVYPRAVEAVLTGKIRLVEGRIEHVGDHDFDGGAS